MNEYEFTLVLSADSDEDEADKMYGTFNDGTISTVAGVPQVHFHREAGSLEAAIQSAISDVRSTGFDVIPRARAIHRPREERYGDCI